MRSLLKSRLATRGNRLSGGLKSAVRSICEDVSRGVARARYGKIQYARQPIGSLRLDLERLEPRQLLAANPLITEFMADNGDNVGFGEIERDFGKPDPFGDGTTPDWIEIFNPDEAELNLEGYHLTDDARDLTQWTFPSTVVQPGGYLLVYATSDTGEDGGAFVDHQGNLHTNFGLANGGDYLALVAPDGTTVLSEFDEAGQDFPEQVADVSYGYIQTASLLNTLSDTHYWVPTGDSVDSSWTQLGFQPEDHGFTAGTAALGYENKPNDRTNFTGQFDTELPSGIHAAYVRAEFDVSNAAEVSSLLLRLKFDNAFIAYLNGVEVASDGAPDNPSWFSTAPSGSRRDSSAKEFEDIDLAEHAGLLQDGTNVLAIHLFNNLGDDSDMLLAFEMFGDKPIAEASTGYLITPTPGASNIVFDAHTGPLINKVTKNPGALPDDQDLLVTAVVQQHNGPVDSVSMHYRTNYDTEITVAMVDDGTGGDVTAGDGIYSATIPATASAPGDMIRWRLEAYDDAGNSMKSPMFPDPIDTDEYFGTIIADPATDSSKLPVLHWFIERPTSANSAAGGRGSFFYLGDFYDNVDANIHGQSSSGFPKKSHDIDFNEGNRFKWKEGEDRVRDINLLTSWADKGDFRNTLAYEVAGLAGDPALFAFPVRVQQNGEFFSVADMVEDADDNTLDRWGMNPDGALYKMYTTFTGAREEKKTRKWEDQTDLGELHDATRLRGDEWTQYAMDNIDIAAFVNFQVVQDITSNHDCCHKNYYFYRDTGETNEWSPVLWDGDLTFGHHWRSDVNYFEDRMSYDNGLEQGSNNTLIGKLWSGVPGFQEMYYRRLRTLTDKFIQPVDTPYEERYFETRLDEIVAMVDPNDDPFDPTPNPPEWPRARHGTVQGTDDADLDYNKWGSWDHGNGSRIYAARGETVREHMQRVKDEYANQRRNYLYGQRNMPDAQDGNPMIDFGVVEVETPNGEASEQYIELINRNDFAVDVSEWRLANAVDFQFRGGTVIPAGTTMYVAADKNAFRARAEGPGGGQGLLMTGGWYGELSTDGETLTLLGADGQEVRQTLVLGNADSPPVRFSEVLPSGDTPDGDKIELFNTTYNDVDVSNWLVSNLVGQTFTIPASTVIPAEGYVVLTQSQLGLDMDGYRGDGLTLVEVGSNGAPVQYVDQVAFGAADSGVSLGHVSTSDWGDPTWVPLVQSTFGGPNAEREPGDVIISEVSYNPPDPDGAGRTKAVEMEYVEVYNRSDSPVDIGGWMVTGPSDLDASPDYEFPEGTVIQPGKAMVVVGFDAADASKAAIFKFTYGMDLTAPLYGDMSSNRRYPGLDDAGGIVQLMRPGTSPADDPDFTPMYLVDEVHYGAEAPWPDSPSVGEGDALARTDPNDYGNFPTSWVALPATPGTPEFSPRVIGDSNEDGQFDQQDLVQLLQAGKYMTGEPASWAQGDWTGDGLFDQRDIMSAVRSETYIEDALAAVSPAADSDVGEADEVFAELGVL